MITNALEEGKLVEIKYAKKTHRLTKALIETAQDMKKIGILDNESYNKITMGLLKKEKKIKKVTPLKSSLILKVAAK